MLIEVISSTTREGRFSERVAALEPRLKLLADDLSWWARVLAAAR
jgi:hypothetical protein